MPTATNQSLAIGVGDLDADGNEDVVWVGARSTFPYDQGPFTVAFGDGGGGFVRTVSVPVEAVGGFPPGIRNVLITDVDGDGGLDLVGWGSSVIGDGIVVVRGRGDGTFASSAWVLAPTDAWDGYLADRSDRVLASDLDGDGRAEVVVCAGPLVTVIALER